MRILIIAAALLALGACEQSAKAPDPSAGEAEAAGGPVKGIDRSHKGKDAPDTGFSDPDGEPATLADFAGKPLLLNLWASWCAPCVKELPTLDRLAEDGKVQVLALSQDSGPPTSVVAFLKSHKIANLEPYQDAKMAMSGALGAEVLPTSVLYDAQGKEVWRYVGDLDWNGAEAAKLLAEAGGSQAR
jgi:thiol-disulfide isomerase/thioredoxin